MDANKIRIIRIIRENPRFRHYPEYKESGVEWIGEMPRHWNLSMLKYAARLVYGDTLISENRENGVVPVYGSNGIIDTHSSANTLSPAIVVGRKGSLGKVQYSDVPCFVIDTAYFIDKRTSHVNLRWLYYVLQALKLERFRNSVLPGLNRESTESQYVPLITVEEQAQIANFLNRKTKQIDELIRIKERWIELLQAQRNALINQVVTKGLDPNVEMKPSGVEWIGEIPGHWEVINTKYLFRLVTEPAPKNNDYELLSIYTNIGVKPRKELEARGNRATTTDGYWLVKKGDFIVNKLLAWMGAIGLSNYEGVTSPAYDILRKSRPLNERFYEYVFRCGLYFTEFKKRSRGIMEVRLRLYFDQFGQIPLVFPPVDEQDKIVNSLDCKTEQIDELIAAELRKIELLKEYRQSLISEAVTGKIDVRNEV